MIEQWSKSDDALMTEYLRMVSVEECEKEISEACHRVYEAHREIEKWRRRAIAAYMVGAIVGAVVWSVVAPR